MSPTAASQNGSDAMLAEIVEDYTNRVQAGEDVDVESYAQKYPGLAERLRKLLPALALLDDLRRSVSAGSNGALAESREGTLSGVLGDFRILCEVGKGGMGVVYEAEQISLRRRVALKVLPFAATVDPRHLQRFHNEAQAAACLHHTNIVPVHYVGCERGVHFYAMQFIDGQPLSEIIRQMQRLEKKTPTTAEEEGTQAYQPLASGTSSTLPAAELTPLSVEGRRSRDYYRKVAELGIQAAEALDHAHQLGIVHRDIKPANLLLDGLGRLWVTDFGLAHIQHSEASLTATGQALGTPRYMSPEQALAKRVPIDHRTDVYSLGATLYEMQTLRPAFQSDDRHELLRRIAFEEPVRPRHLDRSIPAELETIILKAMEKRPQDRYSTAQELADDLRRWLLDQPIRARRPSWVQVARKWARRHQTLVWSAAVCSLWMVAVAGASIGWVIGDKGARRTQVAKKFDEAVQQAIEFTQQEEWPEAMAATKQAAGLLTDAGGDSLQKRQLAQVEDDLKMAMELESARLQRTEVKDGHFDHEIAVSHYEAAFRSYNLSILELDPNEAVHRIGASAIREQLLAALVDWAYVSTEAGQKKKLFSLLRLADNNPWRKEVWELQDQHQDSRLLRLAETEEALAQPPACLVAFGQLLTQIDKSSAVTFLRRAQQRHRDDFWINHNLAVLLKEIKPPQLEGATGFYRAAVALRPRSPGALLNLGLALQSKGQSDEAIAAYREAIRIKKDYAEAYANLGRSLHDKAHENAIRHEMDYSAVSYQVGLALQSKGQLEEAIIELREAIHLKKDHALAHNSLGVALNSVGRLDEAITEFRKAISLKESCAPAHNNLGNALADKGHLEEAIAEYREAIRIDKDIPAAHNNLGTALAQKGRLGEAIAEFRETIRMNKDFAEAHNNLGNALKDKGQLDEAIVEYREAIGIKKDFPVAHINLGNALKDKGQWDKAIDEFCQAIRINKNFAEAHYEFGNALLGKGQLSKAIVEFREAIRLKKDYAEAHCNLCQALREKGQLDEAIAECREAIRLKKDYAEAHYNLGHSLLKQGLFRQAVGAFRRGHELSARQPSWRYPSAAWLSNAESLAVLDSRLPALLKEREQPKDARERIALAQLCQLHKQLYAASARWYSEAFVEQAQLADDLNNLLRYNAACAAALAGCGQGKDADKLDAKERARLRQQALDWLRADLKAYRQTMEKSAGKAGPEIAQRMQHWLQDNDFAGVRGDKALAKLPEAECKDWQKLWQEVEALRQRAAEPPKPASSSRP